MASPAPVNVDPFQRRQGEPRKEVVAGSVSAEEKSMIGQALAGAGFETMSDGVRSLCTAYVKSSEIREAVNRLREAGQLS